MKVEAGTLQGSGSLVRYEVEPGGEASCLPNLSAEEEAIILAKRIEEASQRMCKVGGGGNVQGRQESKSEQHTVGRTRMEVSVVVIGVKKIRQSHSRIQSKQGLLTKM